MSLNLIRTMPAPEPQEREDLIAFDDFQKIAQVLALQVKVLQRP